MTLIDPADDEAAELRSGLTLAEVSDYDGLLAALRARADELSISRLVIDQIAGLCSGYAAKILSPRRTRGITAMTLGPLLQTLGLKLVVVEDPEALAKYRPRMKKRRDDCVRQQRPLTAPPDITDCASPSPLI